MDNPRRSHMSRVTPGRDCLAPGHSNGSPTLLVPDPRSSTYCAIFIRHGRAGLFDELGLGKTMQMSIALKLPLGTFNSQNAHKRTSPSLILVPKSEIGDSWISDIVHCTVNLSCVAVRPCFGLGSIPPNRRCRVKLMAQ